MPPSAPIPPASPTHNSRPSSPSPTQAAQEMLRRRAMRQDLLTWCTEALRPLEQAPAAHHRLLIHELQTLACGLGDRLMVMLPPGAGKSSYSSVLFPAWFLAQGRDLAVLGASHTAALAE